MKKTSTQVLLTAIFSILVCLCSFQSLSAQSVVFDLGPDTAYCGSSITLTAGAGNYNTYLWSTGDSTASITVTLSGTYSVLVVDSATTNNYDTVTITLNPLPSLVVNGNATICSGDSTTLTASGADTYLWVGGPNTASSTVLPTADSVFWVIGTITATGCFDSSAFTVLVNESPMNSQSVTVCSGDSVVVGANTYTASGIYMDTLSTVNGCDSIIMTTLTVDTGVVVTQTLNLCTGDSVMVGSNLYDSTGVYTDTLVSAFGCDSVVVTNLTIVVANAFTQNINGCGTGYSLTVGNNTYTAAGTYTDTLMNVAGCDSVVTTNLTITIVNVNTTVSGFGYIVTATNSNPNTTYQWMNCSNGVQILGAVFQSYYATANGSFACIVTENGCPDTSLCTAVSNVGIADPSTAGSLSVYPNPTANTVTVTNSIPTEIVIYNTLGEVVLAKQIQTTSTVDLSSFEAGVYFICTSEGEMIRLVKE